MATGTNMKQLGNKMETHKFYLEMFVVRSNNYYENVEAILDSSHVSRNCDSSMLATPCEIRSWRECGISGISVLGLSLSRAGRLRGSEFESLYGQKFYLFHVVQNGSGPIQPPIQRILGAISLELKRPRREADHSPPTSAEAKNTWIYASTPPYVFMT
jgi:hypothetical protein